jgi:hypothetical protein
MRPESDANSFDVARGRDLLPVPQMFACKLPSVRLYKRTTAKVVDARHASSPTKFFAFI